MSLPIAQSLKWVGFKDSRGGSMEWWNEHWIWNWKTWIQILALSLITYVTSGKSLFSKTQFFSSVNWAGLSPRSQSYDSMRDPTADRSNASEYFCCSQINREFRNSTHFLELTKERLYRWEKEGEERIPQPKHTHPICETHCNRPFSSRNLRKLKAALS